MRYIQQQIIEKIQQPDDNQKEMDVETENLTENIDDKQSDSKIVPPNQSHVKQRQTDESTLASSVVDPDKNPLPPSQSFKSLSEVDEGNKNYKPEL